MIHSRSLCVSLSPIAAIALMLLAGADRAWAASTCMWIGSDGGNWNVAANWANCNGTGNVPNDGDELLFKDGIGGSSSVNDFPDLRPADIFLTGIGATGNGTWDLKGNRVTLTGGITNEVDPISHNASSAIVELPITLGADITVHFTGGIQGIALSGDIDLNGHVLTIDNEGLVFLNGVISGPTVGGLKILGGVNAITHVEQENTYQGSTEIDGSQVLVGSLAVGTVNAHPFGPGATTPAILSNSAALLLTQNVTLDKSLVLNSGSTLNFVGDLTVTFSGSLTTDANTPLRFVPSNSSQITVTGAIDTPQVSLNGTGTLVLANPQGNNDTWPSLHIANGTIRLGVANVLPNTAIVSLTQTGATFDLNNFDETVGAIVGVGTIQLGSGTLTVNGTAGEAFTGTITGTGNLVKNGVQALQLLTANTFTGTTTVNGGTLELNDGLALQGTALVGPLVVKGGLVKVGHNPFPATIPVTLNAPGVMDLTDGPDTGIGSVAGSGTITLAGSTLTIGANNTSTTYTGAITGPGNLVKTGTGRLVLTGSIAATDLAIASGSVLASGTVSGTVHLTGGTLRGSGTVGDVLGSGGTIEAGPGGVLHAGTVAPTGALTLLAVLAGSHTGTGGYEQLALSGNLTLAPGSTFQAALDFEPLKGETFTIVDVAVGKTVTGTFMGLPEGATLAIGDRHFSISYKGGDGNDIVLTATDAPPAITYYLSEGATGDFFDEDILIANPNTIDAPVTLTFSKEDGSQIVDTRTVTAQSRMTVHVDQISGLEAVSGVSAQIRSDNGLPLVVERSMFWDKTYYAGSTGSAVDNPAQDWFFAEGSQGFFNTFILVNNPNPAPTDVTFTFLLESGSTVTKTITVNATTRLTLYAGDVPELVNQSFGTTLHATRPIMAERSMYFGTRPDGRVWCGGTESAGVTQTDTEWFLAEGATGGFFTTFVLVSNPNATPTHVTMNYLLDSGDAIAVNKTVAANARLTTNIGAEDDVRLKNAAVATVITADQPIIAERSMYWPGAVLPFGEGHNSFGVRAPGLKWGLAEGRTGTPLNYHTYILLANRTEFAAHVTVTFLRETGAPLVKTYVVPPVSRFNIDSATIPELHDEYFGAVIESSDTQIFVERSMYWDSNGFQFSGGTNATGIPLP